MFYLLAWTRVRLTREYQGNYTIIYNIRLPHNGCICMYNVESLPFIFVRIFTPLVENLHRNIRLSKNVGILVHHCQYDRKFLLDTSERRERRQLIEIRPTFYKSSNCCLDTPGMPSWDKIFTMSVGLRPLR